MPSSNIHNLNPCLCTFLAFYYLNVKEHGYGENHKIIKTAALYSNIYISRDDEDYGCNT